MVHPNDGGYFHPGRTTASTTVLNQGPLKATFKSISNNNAWEVVWEIFPAYARMTVIKAGASNYWFLYEGTPGGELQTDSDTLTRSDGSTILASDTWTTDIPSEEWIFVSDSTLGRSIFLIHHQEDEFVDGYFPSNPNNLMTIFGFGRSGNSRFLSGLPRQFTFGLVDSTALNPVKATVNDAYKPLTVVMAAAEQRPNTPTPTNTTIPPSMTPTQTQTPTATATAIASPTVSPTPSVTATLEPICDNARCLYLPFITDDGQGSE